MISKEAVADVLDAAVSLLGDEGETWIKGQRWSRNGDGTISYCPVGAIQEVARNRSQWPDFFIRHGVEKAAMIALANACSPAEILQYDPAIVAIANWNDRHDTEFSVVVRRFRVARKQVMKAS